MNRLYQLLIGFPLLTIISCSSSSNGPETVMLQTVKERGKEEDFTKTLSYHNKDGNNWLIIECLVNGKKARLIIDNGTYDGVYLDKQFALENQLISKNSADRDVIKLKDVEVSAGSAKQFVSQCSVFNLRSLTGNSVDGLLGTAFLENYLLEVNYKNKYLIFHKPDSFKVPAEWVTLEMKRAPRGTGRLINMEVFLPNRKKIVETAQLDLGSAGTPLFFPGSIVRKYQLNSLMKGAELKDLGKFITGERVQGYVYELDSVRLNNVLFTSVASEFTISKQGMSSDVRVLFGNGLLKTLGTVVFDFKSDALYFPGHQSVK